MSSLVSLSRKSPSVFSFEVLGLGELALLIQHSKLENKVAFVSSADDILQVGLMKRPEGELIQPHNHNPIKRSTTGTPEVLIIQSGHLMIDLFDNNQTYLASFEAGSGDIVVLKGGGHGIRVLTETNLVEVKLGPYVQTEDKSRFDYPANFEENQIVI
jgi:hypothetical protein